jgi:hypothetical protein
MARAAVDDMTMRQIVLDQARTLREQLGPLKRPKRAQKSRRKRDPEVAATE